MIKPNTFRKYVRTVLEAAQTVSNANSQGLALMIALWGEMPGIVLYDPTAVKQVLQAYAPAPMTKEEEEDEDERFFRAHMQSPIRDPHIIVGFLAFFKTTDLGNGECWGASEIKMSAANQSYGPLLYNIALAILPNHTIVSDRSAVRPAAENVWNNFFKQTDVEKLPLDDITDPKTPPTEDDCMLHLPNRPALNFAYRGSGWAPGALETNHEKFLKEIVPLAKKRGLDLKPENVENDIYQAGRMFFTHKYKGG